MMTILKRKRWWLYEPNHFMGTEPQIFLKPKPKPPMVFFLGGAFEPAKVCRHGRLGTAKIAFCLGQETGARGSVLFFGRSPHEKRHMEKGRSFPVSLLSHRKRGTLQQTTPCFFFQERWLEVGREPLSWGSPNLLLKRDSRSKFGLESGVLVGVMVERAGNLVLGPPVPFLTLWLRQFPY